MARCSLIRSGHERAAALRARRKARSPSTSGHWRPSRPRPRHGSRWRGRQLEAERTERLARVTAAIAERRPPPPRPTMNGQGGGPSDGRRRRRRCRLADRRAGHRPAPGRSRRAPSRRRGRRCRVVSHDRLATAVRRRQRRRGEAEHIDQTHHWLWPEGYEMLFGAHGLADHLCPAVLEGVATRQAGPQQANRPRSRPNSMQPKQDEEEAAGEAERIRQALGDIENARPSCSPRPTRGPRRCSSTAGRASRRGRRAGGQGRCRHRPARQPGDDEMRAEIARQSAAVAERVIEESLDDETQQRLIEDFIANVGATTPEGSHP